MAVPWFLLSDLHCIKFSVLHQIRLVNLTQTNPQVWCTDFQTYLQLLQEIKDSTKASATFCLERHNPAQQSLIMSGMLKASYRLFPCAAGIDRCWTTGSYSLSLEDWPPTFQKLLLPVFLIQVNNDRASLFLCFLLPASGKGLLQWEETVHLISHQQHTTLYHPVIHHLCTCSCCPAKQTNQINCKLSLQFEFEPLDWSLLRNKTCSIN